MKKNPHAVRLGRKGGARATERQKAAARINGKRGGRPRVSLQQYQERLRVAQELGDAATVAYLKERIRRKSRG